jgi:hypothetical protein
MYADGMGAKEIVKLLNNEGLRTNRNKPWSKTIVYYILSNEIYIGTLVWGKAKLGDSSDTIRIENNHPSLVERDVFEKVQCIIGKRNIRVTHPRTANSDYLLGGLLFCEKCGATMLGSAATITQSAGNPFVMPH